MFTLISKYLQSTCYSTVDISNMMHPSSLVKYENEAKENPKTLFLVERNPMNDFIFKVHANPPDQNLLLLNKNKYCFCWTPAGDIMDDKFKRNIDSDNITIITSITVNIIYSCLYKSILSTDNT